MQPLPAVALLGRRNRSVAAMLIAASFLVNFAGDAAAQMVGRQTGNSLWVGSVSDMVACPLLLWGVSEWQITYFERMMVRISIVPFLLIYVGVTIFVEDFKVLPSYSAPFLNLMTLGAATWTLLRRAMQDTDYPLLKADWFFVLGGLALVAATSAVASPIGAILQGQQRYDLMAQVWELRSAFGVVGMLAVTLGILLPEAGGRAV